MLGANDYLDSKLLRFLTLPDDRIAEIVRDEPNDDRAASRMIEASGKSAAECDAFNRTFAKNSALWLAMIDADEGKRQPGHLSNGAAQVSIGLTTNKSPPKTDACIAKRARACGQKRQSDRTRWGANAARN